MKKLMLTIAATIFASLIATSQVLLQENFTNPFNPSSAGWNVQNLSAVANPTISWDQGTVNVFSAYNGGPNDFYACNFLVTNASSPVTLSVWLLTPTLSIVNGSIIQFATRTVKNPTSYPDRLEVYLSTAGSGTNVGSTPTSLGTFSTLLVSVNPSLTSTGYPGTWVVYSSTVSSVPSPVVGRIGFRYHVTNGGSAPQSISDYIGIDAVKYTGPCSVSVPSFTTCLGTSINLLTLGGNVTNSYSWFPSGSNASSITVTPTSTSVYTLNYSANGEPCPIEQTTITVGTQLSINVISTKNPICRGETATITALGSATSYSWTNIGSGSPSIVVSPTTATVYTVTGSTGPSTNLCTGTNTFQLLVFPTTTINTVVSPFVVCSGKSYSVIASGALSFFWYNLSGPIAYYPIIFATPTVAGANDYTISSIDIYGCTNTKSISIVVNQTPTISVSASHYVICASENTTLFATGTANYNWTGASTSTQSSNIFNNATPGVYSFTAVGTSIEGCKDIKTIAVTIYPCTSLDHLVDNSNIVFQNPFSDNLLISGLIGTVTFFDLSGRQLISTRITGNSDICTLKLPKGVYLLQISNMNGEVVKIAKVIRE